MYRRVINAVIGDSNAKTADFDTGIYVLHSFVGTVDGGGSLGNYYAPNNFVAIYLSRANNGFVAVYAGYKGQSVENIVQYTKTTDPTPTVSSVSTQSLSVNSLNSVSQAPEKVATSQVPLTSYVTVASASASASSTNFAFAPASVSYANLTL